MVLRRISFRDDHLIVATKADTPRADWILVGASDFISNERHSAEYDAHVHKVPARGLGYTWFRERFEGKRMIGKQAVTDIPELVVS